MRSQVASRVCSVLLLVGCAGPARQALAPATPAGEAMPISRGGQAQVTMAVEVPKVDGDGTMPLMPASEVQGGDRLAVQVTVDRPAYVYLVRTRAGQRYVEYPIAGQRQVQPGPPVRLPEEGWIDLDQQTGDERITVVATTDPLKGPLAIELADEKPPPPPPPKVTGPDTRPNRLQASRVEGRFDAKGIAVLSFPFHHR